jgi:hypothetical protein
MGIDFVNFRFVKTGDDKQSHPEFVIPSITENNPKRVTYDKLKSNYIHMKRA